MNDLSVSIHQPFSTTLRYSDRTKVKNATIESFTTFFPGGLYGSASVFIPMNVTSFVPFIGGDRVVIRNGSTIVWEGEIVGIGYAVGGGAEQGIRLDCAGWWQQLLGKTTIDRRWADDRISDAAWRVITAASAAEKATLDRHERLRITQKAEQWGNGQGYTVRYTMPTGEVVGRVATNRNFRENSPTQEWVFRLQDADGATNFWNLTSDVTDSSDDTDNPAGTPGNFANLQIVNSSGSAQTPSADGTYYGQIDQIMVYSYASSSMGTVTVDEIVKDCRAAISNLNSDETNIDTPAGNLTLEPFYTIGPESWASVLTRATSYGDTSYNEWYVRLIDSEKASTPDGKPVLELAQYPALTSFDYAVRLDEPNLQPPLNIVRDYDAIANWIIVKYRDPDNSSEKIVTPDDNANLTDATSTADYGQRDLVVNLGSSNTTTATNIGRKILAARKNPQFHVSGPITVQGHIRGASGERIPTSEIQAGKRIKIENFLDDLAPSGATGTGLTFYVTATRYDDISETCSISTGVPDDIGVMLAQLEFTLG